MTSELLGLLFSMALVTTFAQHGDASVGAKVSRTLLADRRGPEGNPHTGVDSTMGRWTGSPMAAPNSTYWTQDSQNLTQPGQRVNGIWQLCPTFADQFYARCKAPADAPVKTPPKGGPCGKGPIHRPRHYLTQDEVLLAMLTGKAKISQEAVDAWVGDSLATLVDLKTNLLHTNEAEALTLLRHLEKNASGLSPASPSPRSPPSTKSPASPPPTPPPSTKSPASPSPTSPPSTKSPASPPPTPPPSTKSPASPLPTPPPSTKSPATSSPAPTPSPTSPPTTSPVPVCLPQTFNPHGQALTTGDMWEIRNSNMGVAPIHVQLTKFDKILMIDRIYFENIGEASNPTGIMVAEYSNTDNSVRNVTGLKTNSWCSAGAALLGGLIYNLGGGGDNPGPNGGGNSIRRYQACNDGTCEIVEDLNDPTYRLLTYRWYPSATLMPDGRMLIASGQDEDGQSTGAHGDTFEIYPRKSVLEQDLANMKLPISWNTAANPGVDNIPRFLYPHVHLLPTGAWYLQQRNQWYVGHLEPGNSSIVSGPGPIDPRYDDGGTPTTYPADGSSFLLPLEPPYTKATVVTCGATWSYFMPGVAPDPTCAVITPTDANPVSNRTILSQLNPRVMPYCVYMLDGNVACLGGSASGSAGYYSANEPVYTVDILSTSNLTFYAGANATVLRMYHAVATLTASGAIWTGGTNAQGSYAFQYDPSKSIYPSELREETYYPWYFNVPRPAILEVASGPHAYGTTFDVTIATTSVGGVYTAAVIMPGFSTHNQMYSQRYVRLTTCCYMSTIFADGAQAVVCTVSVPDSRNVTPPGDYLLTLLNDGVPSPATFIGLGP